MIQTQSLMGLLTPKDREKELPSVKQHVAETQPIFGELLKNELSTSQKNNADKVKNVDRQVEKKLNSQGAEQVLSKDSQREPQREVERKSSREVPKNKDKGHLTKPTAETALVSKNEIPKNNKKIQMNERDYNNSEEFREESIDLTTGFPHKNSVPKDSGPIKLKKSPHDASQSFSDCGEIISEDSKMGLQSPELLMATLGLIPNLIQAKDKSTNFDSIQMQSKSNALEFGTLSLDKMTNFSQGGLTSFAKENFGWEIQEHFDPHFQWTDGMWDQDLIASQGKGVFQEGSGFLNANIASDANIAQGEKIVSTFLTHTGFSKLDGAKNEPLKLPIEFYSDEKQNFSLPTPGPRGLGTDQSALSFNRVINHLEGVELSLPKAELVGAKETKTLDILKSAELLQILPEFQNEDSAQIFALDPAGASQAPLVMNARVSSRLEILNPPTSFGGPDSIASGAHNSAVLSRAIDTQVVVSNEKPTTSLQQKTIADSFSSVNSTFQTAGEQLSPRAHFENPAEKHLMSSQNSDSFAATNGKIESQVQSGSQFTGFGRGSQNSEQGGKFLQKQDELNQIQSHEQATGLSHISNSFSAEDAKSSNAAGDGQKIDLAAKKLTQASFDRIQSHAESLQAKGTGMAKIQITDKLLGSVNLQVAMGSDGKIHVRISSENQQVKEALEKGASDLKESLQSQNIVMGEFRVVAESKNSAQSNDQKQNSSQNAWNAEGSGSFAQNFSGSGQQGRGFQGNQGEQLSSQMGRNGSGLGGLSSANSSRQKRAISDSSAEFSRQNNVVRGANGSLKVSA